MVAVPKGIDVGFGVTIVYCHVCSWREFADDELDALAKRARHHIDMHDNENYDRTYQKRLQAIRQSNLTTV